MCVQEERRLMMEQGESAMLVTQKKGKSQASQKGKHQIPPKVDIKKDEKCFFYKKKEHVNVWNSRYGLRRKITLPRLFVMNLIWLT